MPDGSARAELQLDWKQPDYGPIWQARAERLERIRETPGMLEGLKTYYAEHFLDFITDWGMTYDPRNLEIGVEATVPMVLFPRQQEFLTWLYERWKAREDGLVEKTRDMGLSWLCVWFSIWMFLFKPGAAVGFGSRKEEYVDKIGDPKCLFWKIRQGINLLPVEFRPDGWDERKHAPHMRVINKQAGTAIMGEAGDNIGRGNRTAVYIVDEAAHVERQGAMIAALSQTSNCKIYVSTPMGAGNEFARMRQSGKIPVFTFHWRDDPRKDDAWYEKQKAKLDPITIAQEVDIDYSASLQDALIPGDLVTAAQNNRPADLVPVGRWVVSIDAAHLGNDESIIHCRKGRLNLPQISIRSNDGLELASRVIRVVKDLEQFGDRVFSIVIELDGPGVSCYDQLRHTKYADIVTGLHTGARLSDDVHYNLRAKLWLAARDYLKDQPVVLPPDNTLKAQLCAMRYGFKNGNYLMQDKKLYRKENGCSPDRADAFILSFGCPESATAGVSSFEPGLGTMSHADSFSSFEPA